MTMKFGMYAAEKEASELEDRSVFSRLHDGYLHCYYLALASS